jgi:hypothetical protein
MIAVSRKLCNACRVARLEHPLLWVACPTAFEVVKRMQQDSFLVYQRHDKFEEYSEQSRQYVVMADEWLSKHADLIVYSSRVLYEEERERKPRSLLIGQGVQLEHFDRDKALQGEEPSDLRDIKRPVVGFFGEIEESGFDMQLVGEASADPGAGDLIFVESAI